MPSVAIFVSAGSFLLGVGLRTVYELPLDTAMWLSVPAFIFGLLWRQRNTLDIKVSDRGVENGCSAGYVSQASFLLSLLFIFSALGVFRTEIAGWQFVDSQLKYEVGETVELAGQISREPDYRENSVQLYVETEKDLVLVTADRYTKYFYGDEVVFKGELKEPEVFDTDLGRTFNYPGYLKAKGVQYTVSFADVEVVSSGKGNFIISSLLKLKGEFVKSMQSVIPEPEVGLGAGLLLGVKSSLGEDIEKDFRRTGIIHIVVLSGYNIMLVVAFIMFVFSFILPFRFRIVAGIIAIVSFALIVGLSATVVRASIMAVLVLVAQVFGRRYNVTRALLLAGVMMILINPFILVYDIGFQLSFMATLGLILIVPHFESAVMSSVKTLGLWEFFLATVSTQIAVLPLLMYHIGEVSLVSVLVNMLVLPVVPAAMLLTFITGMIGFVSSSVASLVGYFATLTLSYILTIAGWFSEVSFASVDVPAFNVWGMFSLYFMMALTFLYLNKRPQNQLENDLSDWVIDEESDR